jgi:Tol biopolymer transport system component
MPLAANSKLGPYEIKSTLGVGGMGEVYRARDSRLNRDVAIKVLREDGASGDLRSRFEREARAVAALSHPNIIAVYDFGIEAGQQYIVSELLEGESLRSLLHGKPVPVRKLIDISAQVADGLAAAHAAGVVHRDLKPENIMLAKDGRVKILDFGLARQSRTAASSRKATGEEETVAPADETKHLTSEGAVLGTASYMSPEQALGKEVDYRSDQFSFGLILHEMASGKQAFARNSSVETMAAIVRDEPSVIEEKIPAPLKWIIDRCLHKEPEQRYESTRDLFHELKNLHEHFSEAYSSSGVLAAVPGKARPLRWKLLAGLALVGLLVGGSVAYVAKPAGQDLARYRYTPFATGARGAVWSPDGKAVAYSGEVNGVSQVFLRYLNAPVAVKLSNEKHGVEVLGWSSDRSHLIVKEKPEGSASLVNRIYSVATVGGEMEAILDLDASAFTDHYVPAALSPDGKALVTFAEGNAGIGGVSISAPLGSPLRAYTPAPFAGKADYGIDLLFSPDGKNILVSQFAESGKQEEWILPYPAGGETPRRVLERHFDFGGWFYFSWMPDNRHLVVSLRTDDGNRNLWTADVESISSAPITADPLLKFSPAVSPNGQQLLYMQVTSEVNVVSLSVEDGSARTLIDTGGKDQEPSWSASYGKLAWLTIRNGQSEIWVRQSDGTERPAVTEADFPPGSTDFLLHATLSPDGERLIFERDEVGNITGALWIASLSGGTPIRVDTLEIDERGGAWSPDGGRVVYETMTGGQFSLTVAKTIGGAKPVVLKEDVGDCFPDWSPKGDWISYCDKNGTWNLISPDGKTSKTLIKSNTKTLAFAKDGKLLYGIETGTGAADQNGATLFSLDPATLKRKVIKELGKELRPASQSPRFSLAPDGKSIAYSVEKKREDLWMLQGYRQPGFWNQIKGAFHFTNSRNN